MQRRHFATRTEAFAAIAAHIDGFYNPIPLIQDGGDEIFRGEWEKLETSFGGERGEGQLTPGPAFARFNASPNGSLNLSRGLTRCFASLKHTLSIGV